MIQYKTGWPDTITTPDQRSHVTIQQEINGTTYGIKPWLYTQKETDGTQLTWLYKDPGVARTTREDGMRIHNWIVC